MPELPEVETVRRALSQVIVGRTIASCWISGQALRGEVPRRLVRALPGRTFETPRRHGKYLLLDLDADQTLLSHLGMSGRWLFHSAAPARVPPHVHVRLALRDGTTLWFEDARRFGIARLVRTSRLAQDPSLAILGPDPIATPPRGEALLELARGARINVKDFLLDQKRIAGIGNIYASEILHRTSIDPRRRAGTLRAPEWDAIAREIVVVLTESIERMGTTFSMYRSLWGEPGAYGEQLRVYDRAGEPCRRCDTTIRRIVQGQRSTYFCPRCQRRTPAPAARRSR
ncbi:MAG: bifunctional DNA-formamidopyrimidine glycosylase/DNA-(apurinic or apyrimidinic site) lyase [Candidatus Eisenbacteria bacterium]|uniref:Formamidopyrimidine-DNA glycosylase n=1 Tax=Eiseniibacteriota bacterium TaxID=2212470 RepID=A0A849SHM5_UNCEI|nr:bifunctional DNA-formamidopyrimidine glycosylase/DNA-(apurinic or apyrimidinic site) lyase [Candidatus Eisenbacteria bacterium]